MIHIAPLILALFLRAWNPVEGTTCSQVNDSYRALVWPKQKGVDVGKHTFNTYNQCDTAMISKYKSPTYGMSGDYTIEGGGLLPCKNGPCKVFSALPPDYSGLSLYPACSAIKGVENTYGYGVEMESSDDRFYGYVVLQGYDGFNGIWDSVGEVYYADKNLDPYCVGGQTDQYNQIYDYYGVYDLVKAEKEGGRRLRGSEASEEDHRLLQAIKDANGPIEV